MENVLITGASGFIGSFLTEESLRRGFQTYAGVRESSSLKYLQDPAVRFCTFDFSGKQQIKEILKKLDSEGIRFDYIIHNAGVTKAQKKDDFRRVNFLYTRNFIESLIETGLIPKKFIYISSLAATGPGDQKSMKPVLPEDPPRPVDSYGRSKLEAEQYINSLNEFPWLIIRPSGVYGPREKDYFVYFSTIHKGMEPYIGFKPQMLTFIYVKDLVRLILDAATSDRIHKAYFVTDGKEYSSEKFAGITKKHLGKKTIRLFLPIWLVGSLAFVLEKIYGLWGSIPTLNSDKFNIMKSLNWTCNVEGIRNDFNFRAQYDLERGIEEALQWYFHEGWLKN